MLGKKKRWKKKEGKGNEAENWIHAKIGFCRMRQTCKEQAKVLDSGVFQGNCLWNDMESTVLALNFNVKFLHQNRFVNFIFS